MKTSWFSASLALAATVLASGPLVAKRQTPSPAPTCNGNNCFNAINKPTEGKAFCEKFLGVTVTAPATQTVFVTQTQAYTLPDAQATAYTTVVVTESQTDVQTAFVDDYQTAFETEFQGVDHTVYETVSLTPVETVYVSTTETQTALVTGFATETAVVTVTYDGTSTIFLTEDSPTSTQTDTVVATELATITSSVLHHWERRNTAYTANVNDKCTSTKGLDRPARISSACSCILGGVVPTTTVTLTATVSEFNTVVQTTGPLATVTATTVQQTATEVDVQSVVLTIVSSHTVTDRQTAITTAYATETTTDVQPTAFETLVDTALHTEFSTLIETAATETLSVATTQTTESTVITLPPTTTFLATAIETQTVTSTVVHVATKELYCGRKGNPRPALSNNNELDTFTNVSVVRDCRNRCRDNRRCLAFAWNPTSNKCTLYKVELTSVNFSHNDRQVAHGWNKACPNF